VVDKFTRGHHPFTHGHPASPNYTLQKSWNIGTERCNLLINKVNTCSKMKTELEQILEQWYSVNLFPCTMLQGETLFLQCLT
jgi:hypothetical protein